MSALPDALLCPSLSAPCSLQTALRATLYGNKNRVDVARLQRLASGFNRFTVDGLPVSSTTAQPQQVNPAAALLHCDMPTNSIAAGTTAIRNLYARPVSDSIGSVLACAAADGGWCSGSAAGAAAGQECAGGAAPGVCAQWQLRGRAVCRGAAPARGVQAALGGKPVLQHIGPPSAEPAPLFSLKLPISVPGRSSQEAAAAADALGRSGAYAVCSLVLDSVPAAFALSLRAGLPPPVQALAPLGPVAFFDR